MSLRVSATFVCPLCGAEIQTEVWGSVNVSADPAMAAAVVDGTLFDRRCIGCGAISRIPNALLYHDMESRSMIAFQPSGGRPDVPRKGSLADSLLDQMEGYRFRAVFSLLDLQEKQLLLGLGRDDRPVELVKRYLLDRDDRSHLPPGTERLVLKGLEPRIRLPKDVLFNCLGPGGVCLGSIRQRFSLLGDTEANFQPTFALYERKFPPGRWRLIDVDWARRMMTACTRGGPAGEYAPRDNWDEPAGR